MMISDSGLLFWATLYSSWRGAQLWLTTALSEIRNFAFYYTFYVESK